MTPSAREGGSSFRLKQTESPPPPIIEDRLRVEGNRPGSERKWRMQWLCQRHQFEVDTHLTQLTRSTSSRGSGRSRRELLNGLRTTCRRIGERGCAVLCFAMSRGVTLSLRLSGVVVG